MTSSNDLGTTHQLTWSYRPTCITRPATEDNIVQTRALKVVIVGEDTEAVLNGLIECLTRTPTEFNLLTTVDFKLNPFQDNAISRDGINEIVTRQITFYTVQRRCQ